MARRSRSQNQAIGCIALLVVVAIVVGLCSVGNREIRQQQEAKKQQQEAERQKRQEEIDAQKAKQLEEAEQRRVDQEAKDAARRAEQEAREAAGIPDPEPSRSAGADCSTGVRNVPVVPGSEGDRDGDGIACET